MILVVGATGFLGGLVTRRLLRKGWEVRILVRGSRSLNARGKTPFSGMPDALMRQGAEPVLGDLEDRSSLMDACRGADIVVTTASAGFHGTADTVQSVDLHGNRNLIDAARHSGIKRLVFISNYFSNLASPLPLLAAKALTEQYLQASGIPHVILAPTAFMESWLIPLIAQPAVERQPAIVIGNGSRKHSFISVQDVAGFTVAALERQNAADQRLSLGGPRAFSIEEAIQVFELVMGTKITRQNIPLGEAIPRLPRESWSFASLLETRDSEIDMSGDVLVSGASLTTLEAFVRRHLAGELA